jgi:hypothetical protein
MRCITPTEVAELFEADGLTINANPALHRFSLNVREDVWSRLQRLDARPTPDSHRLMLFAASLNRWLPTKRQRLLWFSHWGSPFPDRDGYGLVAAARVGLGEDRPLLEAPGHLFEAHDYDNQDQLAIQGAQWHDVSLLASLLSLVMMSEWDAWLIAKGCSDLIEFWEGNLFLYSDNEARLCEADALLTGFDCPRDPL